ncbi:MAG: hypothetical protein ABJC26_10010 [Gemmatimonadaceae bacterium]
MDLYLTSLAIGGLGLVAMAFSGFGRHGQGSAPSHSDSGHGGTGHGAAGHGFTGTHAAAGQSTGTHHVATQGAASHGAPSHGQSAGHSHGATQSAGRTIADSASSTLLSIMSPRVLFSVCLGLGTVGLLLRKENIPLVSGGLPLFAAALVGGILFERLIVTPIWNLAFRFASNPALTLESALMGEATAVTRFDADGNGLIAIEVDGHVVQLLGTLQKADISQRSLIKVGARLRVEEVDSARNRCTVSLL